MTDYGEKVAASFSGIKTCFDDFSNSLSDQRNNLLGKYRKNMDYQTTYSLCLEHEMDQMEEGKKNSTEHVNIENMDKISMDQEIDQLHNQNSEVIGDISTIQVLCHGILLDILEKMFNQQSNPDSEVVAHNHQKINHNDDEILQMNVEEIILQHGPLMKENIVQDIIKHKPSALTSQPLQKMTQKVKGKHLDNSLLNFY